MPYYEETSAVHNRLKKYCESNGLKMGHIITELIAGYLKENNVADN